MGMYQAHTWCIGQHGPGCTRKKVMDGPISREQFCRLAVAKMMHKWLDVLDFNIITNAAGERLGKGLLPADKVPAMLAKVRVVFESMLKQPNVLSDEED